MVKTYTAAALLRKKAQEKQEGDKQMRISNQQAFIKDVLNRFSSNGSVLNSKEVASWLAGLSQDEGISDDELKWILMLGNKSTESDKKYRGSMKELDLDKAVIFSDTFEFVMDSWITYVKNKPTIKGIFQKFDVDRSGSLSREEVTEMLTMLNEGEKPEDEDVQWVMQSADEIGDGEGIEKPEVLQLISAWYIRPSLDTVLEEDAADLRDSDGGLTRKGSMQMSRKNSKQGSRKGTMNPLLPQPAAPDAAALHEAPLVAAPSPVCGQCSVQ